MSARRNRGNPADKANRWRHLMTRERGKCFWCDRYVVKSDNSSDRRDQSATMDHMNIISGDKTYRLDNLVLCCRKCNQTRGTMSPELWAIKVNQVPKYMFFASGMYYDFHLPRVREENANQWAVPKRKLPIGPAV